jgi:hypothetical protein
MTTTSNIIISAILFFNFLNFRDYNWNDISTVSQFYHRSVQWVPNSCVFLGNICFSLYPSDVNTKKISQYSNLKFTVFLNPLKRALILLLSLRIPYLIWRFAKKLFKALPTNIDISTECYASHSNFPWHIIYSVFKC